jgi:hypothetical protein
MILSPFMILFANATAAGSVMQSYITPVIATLCALASLTCTFFLVSGGVQYITSSGRPDKLEHAKKTLKNAVIGLVLVLGAAVLTAVLSHAYASSSGAMSDKLPALGTIQPAQTTNGLVDTLINTIIGLLQSIVQAIGAPFLQALSYFINSTPLMGNNSSVFNLWLGIVGITDILFIVVVALLGFHVMSFAMFGFEEIELKQLLPQTILIFLLVNTSVFAIDGIISLSNGMIYALQSGFPCTSIWDILTQITKKSSELGLAGLLIMVVLLTLSIMLLIYYVGRLITLYIGAVLSPLILLLWLIPAFKDFAVAALKTYLTIIFVLFVHVTILLLASSIFTGMLGSDMNSQPNALMALIVGIATVVALLKTQGVMKELSYAASAPRTARELGGQFVRSVSAVRRTGGGSSIPTRAHTGRLASVVRVSRPQVATIVSKNRSTTTPAVKKGGSL